MSKNTKTRMPKFYINAFYESKFKDSLFIVKVGGKIIEDDKSLNNLMRDIKDLGVHGIKVLLIYGGGNAVDAALKNKNIEVQKHEGRRITDAKTFAVFKDVIGGQLPLKVYEAMTKNEVAGLSFNAVPAEWLDVNLRQSKEIDYGFVGDICQGHGRPVKRLFKTYDFVAIPCLAWADEGTLCNINADTIATELAIATKANKLLFLSDVDGVKINKETAFIITAEQIPGYIKDGTVTGGMKVKMENCARALEAGVKRVHLINGLREDALKKEIFEPVGPGTMLIMESERQHYLNEVEAQKVIEGKKAKS
ncbi:MAG: acetylglutamate kinase, partial [Pseudomonadota bacterium]